MARVTYAEPTQAARRERVVEQRPPVEIDAGGIGTYPPPVNSLGSTSSAAASERIVLNRGCCRPDSSSEMVCQRTPALAANSFCVRSRRVLTVRSRVAKVPSIDRSISGFILLDYRIVSGYTGDINRIQDGYGAVADDHQRLLAGRDSTMTETWRTIPGQEGRYEVSDQGRVRSLRITRAGVSRLRPQPIVLTPTSNRGGYPCVSIAGTTTTIHRLVLMAFVGPLPAGMVRAHLNGQAADNRLVNLAFVTPKENTRHMSQHGTMKTGDQSWSRLHPERLARGDRSGSRLHPDRLARGERNGSRLHPERMPRGDTHYARTSPEKLARGKSHGMARLDDERVRAMRAEFQSGAIQKQLAIRYGVSASTVNLIVHGRIWRHVTDEVLSWPV